MYFITIKNIAALFFTCCISFINPVQLFAQDTIVWSPGIRLTWKNFEGKANENTPFKALTSAGVNYTVTHNSKTFSFKVTCAFYRKKSWVKPDADSDLLLHEQGHFDLAEFFARKLRAAFKKYTYYNSNTIEEDFKKIADNLIKERNEMNKRYDEETIFSQNTNRQRYWNNKIEKNLRSLELYK